MRNFTKIALGALVFAAMTTSAFAGGLGGLGLGGGGGQLPNDIWVTNTTGATLLKGTALAFTIPSIGVKGSFLLPANVSSGQQVKIADIFGGAEAGAPCTVKLA